jgi:predicted dithiol-disulfide oxidoreductase (DUF899 family)
MNFPNEPAAYRAAREELLQAELELRREIESVAAQRRRLPPGGEVPEDYVFDGADGKVRLSELFARGRHAGGLQLHVRAEDGEGVPDVHVHA